MWGKVVLKTPPPKKKTKTKQTSKQKKKKQKEKEQTQHWHVSLIFYITDVFLIYGRHEMANLHLQILSTGTERHTKLSLAASSEAYA